MGDKNESKWDKWDADNRLADQINEKLKLDETGNRALLLVGVIDFVLLILFTYIFEVVILGEKYNWLYSIIFSLVLTAATVGYAWKKRNK